MFDSQNGQSQREREDPKRAGRFTGQRLKVLRPDTYRRVVELLAEPRQHVPYDHICRLLHVSEHTVKAIETRESASVAERKESLLRKSLRIADKAIDRVEDQIDGANITQATVAFGVATDKAMLLSADPAQNQPSQHINLYLQQHDVSGEFNQMLRALEEKARALRELEEKARALPAPQSLPNASEDRPLSSEKVVDAEQLSPHKVAQERSEPR
jgi:hypothetical protein